MTRGGAFRPSTWAASSSSFCSRVSVSYTHLEVYKRQALNHDVGNLAVAVDVALVLGVEDQLALEGAGLSSVCLLYTSLDAGERLDDITHLQAVL